MRETDDSTTRASFAGQERLAERPIGSLISDFLEEAKHLVRAELHLAKSELTQETKKAGAGAGMLAAGGVVALLGAMTLVAFLVLALAQVIPAWASALIVAVVLLAIGAGVAVAGRNKLKAIHGTTKTLQTLKEDTQWASKTMQSVKSPAHGHA